MASIVEFSNVSLQFKSESVLKDLSFTVSKGEKVVFTGPSGVGKTTVIRIIAGFQKPDYGKITVFDEFLDEYALQAVRKNIFWLPQHFNPGNGSVDEFLDSIFAFRQNQSIKPSRNEMVEILNKLLLPEDILGRKMENLSGGQLQRVGLGVGLMIKRPLVLLDEPTSQLDDKSKRTVADNYLERDGLTLISASHDPVWNGYMNKSIRL